MARHIGIVACSAEGAALCYRTICTEAPERMGEHTHPEITMHTFPLAEYMRHIRPGHWAEVGEMILRSAQKLAGCGAELLVCPDNTIHQAYELIKDRLPMPWVHIAEAVRDEAWRHGYSHLGLLGTKYIMTGPVYAGVLEGAGVRCTAPAGKDQEEINRIIFAELVNGIFTEGTRLFFNEVIGRLKAQGCDAVVLGCTEIPLIVDQDDCPLPALDSTRLLARAAISRALA